MSYTWRGMLPSSAPCHLLHLNSLKICKHHSSHLEVLLGRRLNRSCKVLAFRCFFCFFLETFETVLSGFVRKLLGGKKGMQLVFKTFT